MIDTEFERIMREHTKNMREQAAKMQQPKGATPCQTNAKEAAGGNSHPATRAVSCEATETAVYQPMHQ